MKLIAVKQARSIWMINIVDLNPRGRNLLTAVVPALVERYKFREFPKTPQEFDLGKGVKFVAGTFQKDQKDILVNLTVYGDGFISDTRSSTDDSDAFLDDHLSWIATEFDLVPYQAILRTRFYLNEVWVHTDRRLNALNPKLESFAKRLNSLIPGHISPIAYEASGISFGNDPTLSVTPPPLFKFERTEKTSFSENRYYSIAPLKTQDHLEMLDELERILGK
jgi:hypothetical protein